MNIARTSSPESTDKKEKEKLEMVGSPSTKWEDLALTAATKHHDNCQQKSTSSSDAIYSLLCPEFVSIVTNGGN